MGQVVLPMVAMAERHFLDEDEHRSGRRRSRWNLDRLDFKARVMYVAARECPDNK
jgi:hypothetical protein